MCSLVHCAPPWRTQIHDSRRKCVYEVVGAVRGEQKVDDESMRSGSDSCSPPLHGVRLYCWLSGQRNCGVQISTPGGLAGESE